MVFEPLEDYLSFSGSEMMLCRQEDELAHFWRVVWFHATFSEFSDYQVFCLVLNELEVISRSLVDFLLT